MPIAKYEDSDEGPVCPHCHKKYTPDENYYFNESGYEMTCDECDGVFLVRPTCSWWWHSKAKTWE